MSAMKAAGTPVQRLDLAGPWKDGYAAMGALSQTVAASDLDDSLQELVRIRASQINRCAYCLDMHTKDARHRGESEQRLHTLAAWRDAPFFSDAERAALALTEAITLLPGGVPDETVEEAEAHFEPAALAQLVYTIVVINAWNRIAVTARLPVGQYKPS
jgi:AhpD family alkylhydroperoxidase